MDLVCSLPWCQEVRGGQVGKVHFYNFPEDGVRQIQWLDELSLDEPWHYLPKAIIQTMLICSRHFEPKFQLKVRTELDGSDKYKYVLTPDALPQRRKRNPAARSGAKSCQSLLEAGQGSEENKLLVGHLEITPITLEPKTNRPWQADPSQPYSAHFGSRRVRKSENPQRLPPHPEEPASSSIDIDPLKHVQVELEEAPSSPCPETPEQGLEVLSSETSLRILSRLMADQKTGETGEPKVKRGRPKGSTEREGSAADLSCDICGMECASRGSLWTHRQRHDNPKGRRCNLCGKGFTQKANMLRHIRSHLNDRQFKCSYCDEAFVARESVKCHEMKYHTGDFTFTCETCGKGFYQSCNYKLHLRTHTGERPYKCTWDSCDKAYKHSTELKNHLRKHSGERPFACLVCGRTFAIRSCLKAHVNRTRGCGIQGASTSLSVMPATFTNLDGGSPD